MADITNRTQDVSITDNTTGEQAQVVERSDGVEALAVSDKKLAETAFENGRLFHVTTDLVSFGANTETPFFLLKNPTANTYTLHLYWLFLNSTAVTNCTFRMYRGATVTTNGTGLDEQKMNDDGTATASMECYKSPTVTANGTFIHAWLFAQGKPNTDNVLNMEGSFTLKPNSNILFTAQDMKNYDALLSMVWAEIARS